MWTLFQMRKQRLNNFPKVTERVRGTAGTQSQAVNLQGLYSLTPMVDCNCRQNWIKEGLAEGARTRTKPGFITFESDNVYSKILSLHCDSRNAILMQPWVAWISIALVWQGHHDDMYGMCSPRAPHASCHCQSYLLLNMPGELVIWRNLLANALLENEKSSCNENNHSIFQFISLKFFFFLAGRRGLVWEGRI